MSKPGGNTQASSDGTATRRAAVRALVDILEHGTPLEEAVLRALSAAGTAPRDRGFTRHLISTTLRRLGRIDLALDGFMDRPLHDSAIEARSILRVGAAQLLFLDTPAYAAVDRMTGLASEMRAARRYKGLVNAVLRRVSEHGKGIIASAKAADDWPEWLMESWTATYGADTADAIAEGSGREAPLDISVKSDVEAWAKKLGGAVTPLGGVRLESSGDVTNLPGFDEGAWWVQDAAATLPAKLLGDVSGVKVLDLCAAPGGKTMQLAAAGASVTAVERSRRRTVRLGENLARTGLTANIVDSPVEMFTSDDAPYDAVLLDAPCTATGTLRRRPDVAWSKSPTDVASLAEMQTQLIAAAAKLTKPGGRLVFCTCSLQPEEGPGALAAAIKAGAPLVIDPIKPDEAPGLPPEAFSVDGTLRTLPSFWSDTGGMDGFYIARLTRT